MSSQVRKSNARVKGPSNTEGQKDDVLKKGKARVLDLQVKCIGEIGKGVSLLEEGVRKGVSLLEEGVGELVMWAKEGMLISH